MSPAAASHRDPAYMSMRGVVFHYPGAVRHAAVLRNLDIDIPEGEFFVLIGPSGSGKTTVLNLFAGFEHASEGRVIVDGRDVERPGVDRAVIFQGDDSLMPWLTARENIEFGPRVAGISRKERRTLAEKQLELVGLQGQGGKYPSQLSGGMKQRIQLARALACSSSVLLMDEPFGAIDAQTRAALQDELSAIWQRTHQTVFFITHDIAEAVLLADRIGVMTSGPEATVGEVIPVTLDRPRDRSDPAFGALYRHVNDALVRHRRAQPATAA